jgi:hypothetical protein
VLRALMDGIVPDGENRWRVVRTGEELVLEKDESPLLGHTVGERAHNWEALTFRGMRLRWSDVCTESAVHYYCDIPTEWTHALELTPAPGDGDGGCPALLVECSVRHMTNPALSRSEQHPENLQPWLDALLGDALAIPAPTMAHWKTLC